MFLCLSISLYFHDDHYLKQQPKKSLACKDQKFKIIAWTETPFFRPTLRNTFLFSVCWIYDVSQ
jgi:hypothetical protein